ncbi:MAG: hypothetical protein ABGY11_09080 [Candidatus Thioglobus sp.]
MVRKTLKNSFILISIACFLVSCIHSTKLERAERKIFKLTQKFPQLLEKDTVIYRDTLYSTEVRTDTSFIDKDLTDTITITKDRLTIRYFKKDSLIYIEGKCREDTIFIEKKIMIDKIVIRDMSTIMIIKRLARRFWRWLAFFAALFIIIALRKQIKIFIPWI